jgi:hypothetical protein
MAALPLACARGSENAAMIPRDLLLSRDRQGAVLPLRVGVSRQKPAKKPRKTILCIQTRPLAQARGSACAFDRAATAIALVRDIWSAYCFAGSKGCAPGYRFTVWKPETRVAAAHVPCATASVGRAPPQGAGSALNRGTCCRHRRASQPAGERSGLGIGLALFVRINRL